MTYYCFLVIHLAVVLIGPIFVLGIITTPFGLTTMGLVLYGLVRSPLRAKD